MGWRTVVVSSRAKLDYKMGYLMIRTEDTVTRIHISEIAVLMIESTAVSLTAYLLCELAEAKVNIIFCDNQRNPEGLYLPFYGSHDCSQKVKFQIQWTVECRQAIWQKIVSAKITGQMKMLLTANKTAEAEKLKSYLPDIQPGDTTNREGHAAKVYFNALFGKEFTRTDEENPINAELNYGYYLNFRKFLINDGFFMMQESVYCKLAINGTSANALQEHIKRNSPPIGLIQVLTVTEKQYSNMLYLGGTSKKTDIVDSSDRFIVI